MMTNLVQFPRLGLELEIDRVAFTLGGLNIYWYGIIIAAGLLLALVFAFHYAADFGVDADRLVDVVLVGTVCAIVCARAYYVAFAPFKYDSIWDMINLRDGGIAIYGAVIGAAVFGGLACKWRKVPILPTFDLVAMGFLIGQGMGRWGNFFNQEAFGTNTNSLFGMYSRATHEYLTWWQDDLAAQLKLSGKTVRSLIKTYAKEMQENGFCITAKPGRGFGIEITDAQTYVSGSKPQQGEQTGIPQDAQERIQRLRQYLLEKDGYSKLDDLSEQFFVSRRSISNDLREVERQLAEYGLSIRRKPGYGICVVGRETNRRICIAAQRDESRPVGQQIQELVSRVLEKEKFAMSTMALDNLAVHLEVAVERIRTGHAIESSDGMQADLPERILEVASHIAVQIENMTGVAFPLPEVCYIAMHLNGKQMYRPNAMTSDENLVIPQEVNRIVSDMIEHIYEAFRIDFRDNLELRMGLCMHMVPLLARIKSGMRMKNPILQDIKREYPLAYEMATQACSVLQDVSPNPIKEDEIGYIAVSFALALERQKAKEWAPKNILIVCASGKGSAQLLAYRYQQKFGKNLGRVQTCDVIGLRSVNFSKIDYVFSTVPIPIYVPVPIRQIQFFPTEKELTQMKKLLMQGKKGTVEEYFSPELFLPHLNCETREQVLEQMCRFVCGKKKSCRMIFYSS